MSALRYAVLHLATLSWIGDGSPVFHNVFVEGSFRTAARHGQKARQQELNSKEISKRRHMVWCQLVIFTKPFPLEPQMALEALPDSADQWVQVRHTQPTAPIFTPNHMAYRSTSKD
jgi:hypothetical protein